ncbi:histidine--tRNA ligase [Candidatus Woesearchaeota archaeon]|nr:histidine--tRNA ligase [Candidatus Woesearchaeota archaeon]
MKLQLARGTRDFPPEDKIARQELTKTLTNIFERYGFAPLETPVIERMDVLAAKYAGGETADVMKEVFRFQDQGGRELGLRFDLTVPLARYVGMNPELKLPFKRYQIGKVYRDGPIKQGRYREFWQYDVDIVGCKAMQADAEIIRVVLDVFSALGLDVEVRVNNRKLLSALIEQAGISPELAETVIITLDKLDKAGEEGVIAELKDKGFDKEEAEAVIKSLKEKTLDDYEQLLPRNEGAKELKELFSLLPKDERVVFFPSLARGLAYYTGPVFEVYSKDLPISLAGGGRYDDMIGNYLGSKQAIPATGLAFGFEPILDVLKKQGKITAKKSLTQIYVIPIGDADATTVVRELRAAGVNTDVDLMGRGPSKNLRYADAYGIPYALFVGEDERKAGKYTLRDLQTGEEKKGTVQELISTTTLERLNQ